jgi:biotin carboxylase
MTNKALINKKLLILGANPETIPLIETAKSLGVYVIVTDFNDNAPAKKYADKACNVDGLDISGLIDLCISEKIDGVMVGVADRLILPYFLVCNALGLPCYATKEHCDFFTNKGNFNELCARYNIKTIPNYNDEFQRGDISSIKYPVFVKPTDANSGKGMSICHNELDLNNAVAKAKNNSNSKGYLIERYMECDDIFIYYTFKDGDVFVSAMADRFTTDKQGDVSRVCIEAKYPSKYVNLYFEVLHKKMIQMFTELKVKNGIFMISAFVEDNNIYIYDPGFRLQGEAPNIPLEAVCGFDQKAMLVNYALTGSMGDIDLIQFNNPYFNNKFTSTIWFLANEGKIAEIKGLDKLANDSKVIKIVQRLYAGDIITKEMIGTEAQVILRLYLFFNSSKELLEHKFYYQNLISVLDVDNNSMLIN